MTQFTLNQNTQTLINTAVSSGPGTNNINYKNAYNAIYNELVAHGNINAGTLYWFSQAANVNAEATSPNAAGRSIWAYTEAAAASEGATVTDPDMQAASDKIALTVFTALKDTSFLFDDTTENSATAFAPKDIIADDAGAGLDVIKTKLQAPTSTMPFGVERFSPELCSRISTYFSDYSIQHPPGSRDANAMFQGLFAGVSAVVQAGGTVTSQGITAIPNLDLDALWSSLSSQQQAAVTLSFLAAGPELTGLATLAAGAFYIWNTLTGDRITLSTSSQSALPVVYAYNPGTYTSPPQITSETVSQNADGSGSFTDDLGNQFASYSAGQLTDGTVKVNGSEIDVYNSDNQIKTAHRLPITATTSPALWIKYMGTTALHRYRLSMQYQRV